MHNEFMKTRQYSNFLLWQNKKFKYCSVFMVHNFEDYYSQHGDSK